MPRFSVGDRVERIGSLIPGYMRNGVIIRIIPNKFGLDRFTEYEVSFEQNQIAICYETQLRLMPAGADPACSA